MAVLATPLVAAPAPAAAADWALPGTTGLVQPSALDAHGAAAPAVSDPAWQGLVAPAVEQVRAGGPTLAMNIAARPSCGWISQIQFGLLGVPFDNARIGITAPVGGPVDRTVGFGYAPPTGTTTVTVALQRVVPSGGATVDPIAVDDACGQYTTFVGGGSDAFVVGDLAIQFSDPATPPATGGPGLGVTVIGRAGCGAIERIRFGQPGQPFDNARVTISAPGGGPDGQAAGFDYVPPPAVTSVSLLLQRVKQQGGATVSPVLVFDDCGQASTLIGAGSGSFKLPSFGVQVGQQAALLPTGGPGIDVRLTARPWGCGPIQQVTFGQPGQPLDNARLTVVAPGGGPSGQTTGFVFAPPGGASAITLTLQRAVQDGGAMVRPVTLRDECGEWATLFGAGEELFPLPNAGVSVGTPPGLNPSSVPTLNVTLAARVQCGPIGRIDVGRPGQPFANARVTVTAPSGGPSGQTSGFVYLPPPGTTTVRLALQRVVQAGGATVSPIVLHDGCGSWHTFVGGGERAFQ